ncbi:MAG: bifunctional hydroxymethylpyrimidine kinase/phosphomethylpyrimidine kinase [Clostridiales bacterium]|jgi:pyridoxal/pyridoxine/pyridoxamine kinase|nr:bifunctional hydroxymethylpyrimidine kinase/phosphomethylpyrimidine kinase [Clostridiales bacterium]
MNILAINDLSTLGKASLGVVLPILSTSENRVYPLPSCVLSSITSGFGEYTMHELTEFMQLSLKHILREKVPIDWIYTGYLINPNQAEMILQFIDDYRAINSDVKLLVDPVLGDDGVLYSSMTEAHVLAMKSLVEVADITTPNYTEYKMLKEVGTKFGEGCVITSHPNEHGLNCDVVVKISGGDRVFAMEYSGETISGTGDMFCAAVLNGIARQCSGEAGAAGYDLCDAVEQAIIYIKEHILELCQ